MCTRGVGAFRIFVKGNTYAGSKFRGIHCGVREYCVCYGKLFMCVLRGSKNICNGEGCEE